MSSIVCQKKEFERAEPHVTAWQFVLPKPVSYYYSRPIVPGEQVNAKEDVNGYPLHFDQYGPFLSIRDGGVVKTARLNDWIVESEEYGISVENRYWDDDWVEV